MTGIEYIPEIKEEPVGIEFCIDYYKILLNIFIKKLNEFNIENIIKPLYCEDYKTLLEETTDEDGKKYLSIRN